MNIENQLAISPQNAKVLAEETNKQLMTRAGSVELVRALVAKLGGRFMSFDDWGELQARVEALPMGERDPKELEAYLLNGGEAPRVKEVKVKLPTRRPVTSTSSSRSTATASKPETEETPAEKIWSQVYFKANPIHEAVKAMVQEGFGFLPKCAVMAMDLETLEKYEKYVAKANFPKKARGYAELFISRQKTRIKKDGYPLPDPQEEGLRKYLYASLGGSKYYKPKNKQTKLKL